MTRDEVMALSDEELWIRACEILDKCRYAVNGGNKYGPALSPYDPGTGIVQDVFARWWDTDNPVTDIAAAWPLLSNFAYAGVFKDLANDGWSVEIMDANRELLAEAFDEGQDGAAHAITRAFILAMSGAADE